MNYLRAEIFRGTYNSKLNLFEHKSAVLVVGVGYPQKTNGEDAFCKIIEHTAGKQFGTMAVPCDSQGKEILPTDSMRMMGGTFVYSCDSRFRDLSSHGGPVAIHDRFEK